MKNQPHSPIDELSKRFLKPEVDQAFPDVDLEVKKVAIEFGVKDIQFRLQASGVSIAIFLIGLITVLVILLRG